jgi:hypothetical protein
VLAAAEHEAEEHAEEAARVSNDREPVAAGS